MNVVGGVVVVAIVLLLGACDTPSVGACKGICVKRAECLADVDADTCSAACADSEPAGDQACIDADVAYQTCLAGQACADFVESAGCEVEAEALAETCRLQPTPD